MSDYTALHWEMMLRGGVAALLLFHVIHLSMHRARPAARAALIGFTLSVLAYLFCQQSEMLLAMPRFIAMAVLAFCVSGPVWLWLAARAMFDDDFRFSWPVSGTLAALLLLGLAANVPYFPDGPGPFRVFDDSSWVAWVGQVHRVTILVVTGAALWAIARGWNDDLVEPRRAARRWVAMGVAAYAAIALVVELALRGQVVGRLLPALHVLGIGAIAMALALYVARRPLDEWLGVDRAPPVAPDTPAADAAPHAPAAAAPPSPREAQGLARLQQAMANEHLYRREGLTLATLATTLGLGEAALRALINHQLGYRNFNDFLHHYRLQEAAERLAGDDRPVLSIALECGYGSIGPFNRAFKQRFGITPTEFRGAKRLATGATGN